MNDTPERVFTEDELRKDDSVGQSEAERELDNIRNFQAQIAALPKRTRYWIYVDLHQWDIKPMWIRFKNGNWKFVFLCFQVCKDQLIIKD